MRDPELSNTVSILDVAESVTTLESNAAIPARFAGGEDIQRERQMNPFIGWQTSAGTPRAYRLRDVVLDRSLMVLLKDGHVIAETNYLQSPQSIAEARVRSGSLVRLETGRTVATCFDHWDTNYYHWLAHAVPAIHAIRQRHTKSDIGLVVPRLHPWQQRSLALLGAADLPRIESQPGMQYWLPDVEYYDFVAGCADFSVSALSCAAYARMSEGIEAEAPAGRRIYIDRGTTTNRKVQNESALVAKLAERGFHIVRPETLSLEAQIALFRSASMVVGQLGAGLANIAFCRPGTIVYELVPEHHRNPCFLAMALQGDLEYWADVFPTGVDGADHTSQWTRPIDVAHVIRRIDELEALVLANRHGADRRPRHQHATGRVNNDSMARKDDLSALATKYGSDKWGPHSYTRHYETHFAHLRHRPINILEIGVGGYDDPTRGGASLRMWSDYFPEAKIFALDFFEKRLQLPDRIRIYQGSQADADLLRRINDDAGGFDIIIDDGSHINEHVIASFETLFPLLRNGGLYVVEDTQTSYWPALGGSSDDPDSPGTMMGFFKGLVHGLNHAEFIGSPKRHNRFDKDIVSISFYHNMIFVAKGDNSEPSNVPPDDPLRRG